MSIATMTYVMLGFTAAGSVVGGLIGYLLGRFDPDFYTRAVGKGDPVQIGLGFGIAQGLTMGFLFGCLVLVLTVVSNRHHHSHHSSHRRSAEMSEE